MNKCPLPVGGEYSYSRVIDQCVYDAFLVCSEDRNPLHVDDQYAREYGFSGKLMHGALLNAMLSGFVGGGLPVKDTMCLMQKVNFKRPFYLGSTVLLHAVATEIQGAPLPDKWIVEFAFKFMVNSKIIANGDLEVLVGLR